MNIKYNTIKQTLHSDPVLLPSHIFSSLLLSLLLSSSSVSSSVSSSSSSSSVDMALGGGAWHADRQVLERAWLDELSATYGQREAAIRRQYAAACHALTPVGGHAHGHAPGLAHVREFRLAFEREKSELALEVLYRGVVGRGRGLVGPGGGAGPGGDLC